jgi:hypothetical protein
MRLESSDSVTQLMSSLAAIAALLAAGWIGWKAYDVWRSDPAVREIQQILEQRQ